MNGKEKEEKEWYSCRETQVVSLGSQLKHLGIGVRKVESLLSEIHPDKISMIKRTSITFLVSLLILKRKGKSVTLGSPPKNKWMIFNDKGIFSNNDTLITSWFQMLALVSIGKERDFKPFWTGACQENSKNWWLPTGTDCAVSGLNSWSPSSPKKEVRLVVLNRDEGKSPEQELADDVISIIHVYSCRSYGKRRYKTKDRGDNQDEKGETVSDCCTERETKGVDGNSEIMCITSVLLV